MIVVGLGHQAQVGKDTAAEILCERYGFQRLAFADQLKAVAYASDPLIKMERATAEYARLALFVDALGWERAKENADVRRYLQKLGVGAREHIADDVWVQPVLRFIRQGSPLSRFVVTDVRFQNEFKALHSVSAQAHLIKLTRDTESNAGTHVSETQLSNANWDAIIENNGTIEELEQALVSTIGLN